MSFVSFIHVHIKEFIYNVGQTVSDIIFGKKPQIIKLVHLIFHSSQMWRSWLTNYEELHLENV